MELEIKALKTPRIRTKPLYILQTASEGSGNESRKLKQKKKQQKEVIFVPIINKSLLIIFQKILILKLILL